MDQSKDWREERKHYGDEPHYFWITFEGEDIPKLLNVDEVWEAHRRGKKAVVFRPAPLDASERAMLRFLAEDREADND